MSELPKKSVSSESSTPGRVRTSNRKRKSVDPISPVPTYISKKEEVNSHISTWNDESLDKLTTYLQENGFDHDFLALQKEFPAFSHHSLRAFFNELSRWSSDAAVNPLEDEVEAKSVEIFPFCYPILIALFIFTTHNRMIVFKNHIYVLFF